MNILTPNIGPSAAPQRHSIVSLFSGCGGLDLGFLGGFEVLGKLYPRQRFEVLWANDMNAAACRTYVANIGHQIHLGDIWDYLDTLPATADVVVGGFPCQDISINGKGRGIAGARSGLYRAMVEAVHRLSPPVFIAENVKALLMKHNKASLAQVMNDFEALGYTVDIHLLNAADFGVPQTRERVFLIGRRNSVSSFDISRPNTPWVSAQKAIDDLAAQDWNDDWSHIWSVARRSPEQGDRRLKRDRPGYTIRAECHGNIQFHYDLDRRISMREAARIQSFPDSFHFKAKLRETERMIGNAVPPVLAWHIGKSVSAALTEQAHGALVP